MRKASLAWSLVRAEGLRGLAERLADRRDERGWRAGEHEVLPEDAVPAGAEVPVLDVLSTPLSPRWGGVPTQLGARLGEERKLRSTALLAPDAGRWTLRTACGPELRRVRLAGLQDGTDPAWLGIGAVSAVHEAMRLTGAAVVNVEGAAGWSPEALVTLAGPGRRVVLSLHDFALFCPRPNLVEMPQGRFCGYSRDPERCRACLSATWSLPAGFVSGWRAASEELLSSVDAVVYPSDFLRRRHRELFPGARPRRERVIAPAPPAAVAASTTPAPRRAERGAPVHVAFVGAYRPHKGAAVFEELLRRESRRAGTRAKWSILGSGDPALLVRARRLGGRVLGHYRAGSLASRLRQEEVDVALLLSIWPEAFGLTLSECRAAGVPVLAFAHGAIAERVEAGGGGVLVPPGEGAEGVATALANLLSGRLVVPPFRGETRGASAFQVASERADLYRTLLSETT